MLSYLAQDNDLLEHSIACVRHYSMQALAINNVSTSTVLYLPMADRHCQVHSSKPQKLSHERCTSTMDPVQHIYGIIATPNRSPLLVGNRVDIDLIRLLLSTDVLHFIIYLHCAARYQPHSLFRTQRAPTGRNICDFYSLNLLFSPLATSTLLSLCI